jgi:hypothetical protein
MPPETVPAHHFIVAETAHEFLIACGAGTMTPCVTDGRPHFAVDFALVLATSPQAAKALHYALGLHLEAWERKNGPLLDPARSTPDLTNVAFLGRA